MGDQELLRLCAEAATPAFVRPGPPPPRDDDGGESVPAIDFPTFAEHMETLVNMIDSHVDIKSPECAALGTFICNHGTKEDNAEALLAIMPVATRVFQRYDAEQD